MLSESGIINFLDKEKQKCANDKFIYRELLNFLNSHPESQLVNYLKLVCYVELNMHEDIIAQTERNFYYLQDEVYIFLNYCLHKFALGEYEHLNAFFEINYIKFIDNLFVKNFYYYAKSLYYCNEIDKMDVFCNEGLKEYNLTDEFYFFLYYKYYSNGEFEECINLLKRINKRDYIYNKGNIIGMIIKAKIRNVIHKVVSIFH